MKKILRAALFSLILSSCGYTMAGLNNEVPVKYYINTVQNDTIDSTLGDIMQLEAERFFVKYNELASYKQATYFMDIIISKLEYVNPILTATDQATSTNLSYNLTIIVTDIDGKEIYTWNTTTSTNFSITSNVARTLQTRDSKLKNSIEDDLTTFRLNISRKVYK